MMTKYNFYHRYKSEKEQTFAHRISITMSSEGFFGLLKKLALFVSIFAIAIPIRYESANPNYLLLRLIHSALSLKHSIISDPDRPTLSADYRAFEELLRKRPIFNLNAPEDSLTKVKRLRSGSSTSNIIIVPSSCNISKEVFQHDGHTIDTYWIDNHQKKIQRHADHIIIYFHGGGYLFGDIESK